MPTAASNRIDLPVDNEARTIDGARNNNNNNNNTETFPAADNNQFDAAPAAPAPAAAAAAAVTNSGARAMTYEYYLSESDFSNHSLGDEFMEDDLSNDHLTSIQDSLYRSDENFCDLELELYDHFLPRLGALADAIEANTSVTNVSLCYPFADENWRLFANNNNNNNNNRGVERLLRAIARLPKLTRLHLHSFQFETEELPVSLISFLLDQAAPQNTLVELYLSGILLSCHTNNDHDNVAEFETLGRSLTQLTSLRRFSVSNSYLCETARQSPQATTILLKALAQLPHLTTLLLEGKDTGDYDELGTLDPTALGHLFQLCTSLVRVRLSFFTLTDDHLQAMARGLLAAVRTGTCPQIREVALSRCEGWNRETAQALAELLQINHLEPSSSLLQLEKLTIYAKKNRSVNDASNKLAFLETIAKSLPHNSSLKWLAFREIGPGVCQEMTDTKASLFIEALESNYTLESLHVLGGIMSFCKEHHHHAVKQLTQQQSNKLDLYLKLNRMGRRKFFVTSEQDTSVESDRNTWVEQLIRCNHDLDCLFYFLSLNPMLCKDAVWMSKKLR